MTTFNRPVAFTGSDEQRTTNRQSHRWVTSDGEIICAQCDHKIWHLGADYPCGQQPDRETVTRENPTILDMHPGIANL